MKLQKAFLCTHKACPSSSFPLLLGVSLSLVIAQLLSLVPPLIGSLGVSLSLVIARLLSSCVTLDRISRHLVTRGAILATRGVIHAYHAAGQRRRQIVVAVVRRRLLRVYLMQRLLRVYLMHRRR